MIKKAVNPIYGSEFDVVSEKLKFKYVIYSQQRTGSTWLCNRLINIKKLGVPAEYLNTRGIQAILNDEEKDKIKNINEYLKFITKKRTSIDGNFGIKVQPNHLSRIFKKNIDQKIEFLNSFNKIIRLKREDKLNQAISATIAMMTDQWWTFDGKVEKIPEEKFDQVMAMIAMNLNRILIEEYETEVIMKKVIRPTLSINYKEIEENSENVFQKVINFLIDGNNKLNEFPIVKVPVKAEKNMPNDFREKFLSYIS